MGVFREEVAHQRAPVVWEQQNLDSDVLRPLVKACLLTDHRVPRYTFLPSKSEI